MGGGIKSKAFTLIELLAVIIILGVISLIIYPMITAVIKNQEQKTFKQSLEGIISTIRTDMADDDHVTPRYYYYENGSLKLLTVNGKERNQIIKTTGKTKANGYILVDIDGNIILDYLCDKKYCGYNTENNSEIIVIANENINTNLNIDTPILTLKGESKITLNINDRYIEKGVTAKTKVGEDLSNYVKTTITKNDTIVNSINTKEEGTYLITYTVTYKEETVSVNRTVEVKEETPVITITEANGNYVKEQTIHIKVSPVGENIINNFIYTINGKNEKTVTGTSTNLTLNETGEYVIEVDVVDNHGHRNKLTSNTYKIDTIAPTIKEPEIVQIKATEVGGYDPTQGIEVTDNIGVKEIQTIGSLTSTIGKQTVTIKVIDIAGNSTSITRTIEVIPAEGPILNLSTVRTEGWVNGITITATTSAAINIQTFTYEIIKNGTSLGIQNGTINGTSGTIDIPLTETGIYQIKLVSTDNIGNISNLTSGEYKIDTTGPVITNITNPNGENWATENFSLTINAIEEESEIAYYQYSYDKITWYTYANSSTETFITTPFVAERNQPVYIRAFNTLGISSEIKSTQIRLDKTPPTNLSIVNPTNEEWTDSPFSLTLSAKDNISKIAYYQYSYDQLTWYTYANSALETFTTTPFVASRNQPVYIRVYNNAGLASEIKSTQIRLTQNLVQVKTANIGSESYVTLNVPSSQEKPTIAHLGDAAKENYHVGVKIYKMLKKGDIIEISYSVTRHTTGTYYIDTYDNFGQVEGYISQSNNGVIRTKTRTVTQDTSYYDFILGKTDIASLGYSATMYIYSITINGEKVL